VAIDPTKLGVAGEGPSFDSETLHLLPISGKPPSCSTCGGSGTDFSLPVLDSLPQQCAACPDCKGQRYPIGERITIAVECRCGDNYCTGQRPVATGLLQAVLPVFNDAMDRRLFEIEQNAEQGIESPDCVFVIAEWSAMYVGKATDNLETASWVNDLLDHADWDVSHALKLTAVEVVG
jgi:DnaJ-class molecular chaperone